MYEHSFQRTCSNSVSYREPLKMQGFPTIHTGSAADDDTPVVIIACSSVRCGGPEITAFDEPVWDSGTSGEPDFCSSP